MAGSPLISRSLYSTFPTSKLAVLGGYFSVSFIHYDALSRFALCSQVMKDVESKGDMDSALQTK